MRFLFLFALVIMLTGCAFQKTPLNAENMQISQQGNEILLKVNFTGNDIPEKVNGKMAVIGQNSETIYDSEFFLKSDSFSESNGGVVLKRYIKTTSNESIRYANLTLFLPNQTFYAEYGNKPIAELNYIQVDAIPHETQYAINIKFFDNYGKPIKPEEGNISIVILDADGRIYSTKRIFDGREFQGDYLNILLPYSQIDKSFYENGSVVVTTTTYEKQIQKNTQIKLQQYTKEEMKNKHEKYYMDNAVMLDNTTNYVGFVFYIKNAGIYIDHAPDRKEMIRFDTVLKNNLPRPQYLVRDDFYMKDEGKNFYPVSSVSSTAFGPLLMKGAVVNATFYFEKRADKKKYIFYYGDKALAVFEPN